MNFRSFQLLGALVIVVCIGATALAETVTFQKGFDDPFTGEIYTGAEDNLIIEFDTVAQAHYANSNFGQYPFIGVGVNGANNEYLRKELMRFDLTSLAGEYESINSVKLRLYPYTSGEVNFANNLLIYRLSAANGDWVEGTRISFGTSTPESDRTVAPEVGSSCWNYRAYNDTPWASGTPGTDTTDYDGGPIASLAFDSKPTDWVEFEFTDLSCIDDWVAGNNTGMILRVETETNASSLTFYASHYWEDNNAQYRPQLVIDYTPVPNMPGDATKDDIVNELDAERLAANWLGTNKTWEEGDFNNDGVVNDIDAAIMAANWQATAPSGAVPEPGTAVLLLGGLGALLLYRRISA